MSRTKIASAAILSAVLLAGAAIPFLHAQSATPTAAATKTRDPEVILKDVTALDDQITTLMPTPRLLADPDFRTGDGQKALPLLRRMDSLFSELQAAAKAKDIPDLLDDATHDRNIILAYTVALGDKDATSALEADAAGKGDAAVDAHSALALGRWFEAGKDSAKQRKIVDDIIPLAKENPANNQVAIAMSNMANLGTADADMKKNIIEVVRTLKSPVAKQIASDYDSAQAQLALVGKPLTVAGRTSIGGHFSSADLKGKVVLVDFWATWCGPCRAELPNVQKTYGDLHPKGLEIVGVSCDADDKTLNDFTAKNAMPWVQLRESSQDEKEEWHPLAKLWHVDGIPTMFLIDKKGVLRYVDAREDLAKKAAELLAEKD